jgi:hypothetical protein
MSSGHSGVPEVTKISSGKNLAREHKQIPYKANCSRGTQETKMGFILWCADRLKGAQDTQALLRLSSS